MENLVLRRDIQIHEGMQVPCFYYSTLQNTLRLHISPEEASCNIRHPSIYPLPRHTGPCLLILRIVGYTLLAKTGIG